MVSTVTALSQQGYRFESWSLCVEFVCSPSAAWVLSRPSNLFLLVRHGDTGVSEGSPCELITFAPPDHFEERCPYMASILVCPSKWKCLCNMLCFSISLLRKFFEPFWLNVRLPNVSEIVSAGRQRRSSRHRDVRAVGSMTQMKRNGSVELSACSHLWALKKVKNAIDVSLSWVFIQSRGHERQQAACVFPCFTAVKTRWGHSLPSVLFTPSIYSMTLYMCVYEHA